jgi:PAS domain S-box-containing protein
MQEKELSREQLLIELNKLNLKIASLTSQLQTLQQEKGDLEVMLQTTTEHSDILLNELQREKADLEILLEMTTQHSILIESELHSQAKEARRETEEQFRLIAEATPVAILISQISDGQILYANPTAGLLVRLRPDELLQYRTLDFLDYHQRQEMVADLLINGQVQGELLVRRLDQTSFWALVSLRLFRFQGRETILTALYDITDRKQVEEALRIAERKYRTIFENALEGIFQSTPDGQYISVNPALARMFGYESPDEMMRMATNISNEYVEEQGRETFKQLIESRGEILGFERPMYRQDGSTIWVSESSRAVRDDVGNLLYYEGIIEDITQRRQAEDALRLAESKFRSIFENAVEGIYQSSPEGCYLSVNPAMAAMYGYDSPENMIETVTNIAQQICVEPDQWYNSRQILEEQGEIKGFEYQVYQRQGTTIWISEWARAVRDAQGTLLYYEGSCIDITQRKQEEESLKQQLREMQVEIDQQMRIRQVTEITQTEYFQNLIQQAQQLRHWNELPEQ